MKLYGTALPRTDYERQHDATRNVVGAITTSIAGNVILRIGKEDHPGGTWHLAAHVTLTPDEARALAGDLERFAGEPEYDGPSCERCHEHPAATCECDEQPEPEPHHDSDLLPMPGDDHR